MNEEEGLWIMSALFLFMSAPTQSLLFCSVSVIFLLMAIFAHRYNIKIEKESEGGVDG